MNKVRIFEVMDMRDLERCINSLAKEDEIVNVSISAYQVGRATYYAAAVLYRA